jgi:hypothetical protein
VPHGCPAGSPEWETLSASPVSFSEAFRQSRSWWWTRDALCVCGHLACDEHSSTDDDGPYGDMCLYCGCDRSSFDAFIATARWPVRAIVRLSRAWLTSPLRIGLADMTHDCGRVFGCRTCATARCSYSVWYRRGQFWRGRRAQVDLVCYEDETRPGYGRYRMLSRKSVRSVVNGA